eukprot:3192030-Rhodomonas_salina.2
MAVHHVNHRVASLVPKAAELLPANFKLVMDLQDSMAQPSVAVGHTVAWNEQGRHAIIGAYRSAVTGPVALAASIAGTPVITWAATASSLSDEASYPTLSRTIFSDAMLAQSTIQIARAVGWTRIAILYVNDEWGRSFSQDLSLMANMLEVEVVAVSAYSIGDPDSIQNSIRVIAGSLARVVLCTTYQVDLASIAEAADREGLLSKGYAWVLTALMDFNDIISQSPDPEKTRQRLTGWMLVANNLDDALSARFQEVFRSEPLEHLNRPRILENSVSETIVSNMDEYCAAHYDAVWTAAIAMSSMDLGEDGTVDKGALLLAIRNVSFEGASGQVLFGQDGDRDPSGVPMLLQNLRPTSRRSGSLG